MNRALALVPARGGSKRLPRKNVRLLRNKPLVAHTIEAALESDCFTAVMLNSDDPEILSIGNNYKDVIREQRPERLARDDSTVLETVCEITARKDIQLEFDIIALLLPTCPFRTASHIKQAFKQLSEEIDGIVSVTTYEFPPQLSVFMAEESMLEPVFEPCPLITGNTRSQDQKTIFRPNGGFYISWMSSFLRNRNFFKGKVKGFPMSRLSSVDIDSELDFEYAEYLMDRGYIPDE